MDTQSIIVINRIQKYENAQWISPSRANFLRRRIRDHDYVTRELQKILDQSLTVNNPSRKNTANSKSDPPEIKPTPQASSTVSTDSSVHRRQDNIQSIKDQLKEKRHHQDKKATAITTQTTTIPTKSEPSVPLLNTTNNTSHQLVWEPKDFTKVFLTRDKESTVRNLFVESCFFARMGFLQPPCCLMCGHAESPTADCARWVVWRKNAKVMMHPEKIGNNLMVMSCGTAQKLIKLPVEGWVWDEASELLYETGNL